jgi:hypothetical protein
MAPSAIETITEVALPSKLKLHSTQSARGDYKELLPVSYDVEAEEGKKGHAGAKVRSHRFPDVLVKWSLT